MDKDGELDRDRSESGPWAAGIPGLPAAVVHLAQTSESGRLYPTSAPLGILLYEYYGIDPVALEQERRALLEQARKYSDTRGTD